MASYNNSIRYTRPLTGDRPGPRFNTPQNRNLPRNNFNDIRPQIPKANNTQQQSTKPTNDIRPQIPKANNTQQQSTKPTTEPNTAASVPANIPTPPSTQSQTTIPEKTNLSTEAPKPVTPINNKPTTVVEQPIGSGGQKRSYSSEQSTNSTSQKATQGGRSRLFIGNIPSDLTQEEFQALFGKYGELIEYYVNPARGFGFVKLSSKQFAEQAKSDLDGFTLRGKPLRIRFASQGAIVKVKNLSTSVSNELLKEAFEQYFGNVERAVVLIDDRGKSIGEGIVEFEKKPSAQKCLNDCTERCFFLTGDLKPIIVEPWDMRDEDDGLPERTLLRSDVFFKERQSKPRFAEPNTIEYTIGLKWKQLELQEKQLLEEVKGRMQQASTQLQVEVDQMLLEYEAQKLRDELTRRQEDLRRIDELRSYDFDRRRNMMPMHRNDAYNGSVGNVFHQNQAAPPAAYQYNNFQQNSYPNTSPLMQPSSPIDAAYTTNQIARGYNLPTGPNIRPSGVNFNQQQQQQQGFDRKRPRY